VLANPMRKQQTTEDSTPIAPNRSSFQRFIAKYSSPASSRAGFSTVE
jgi:hypothetical protein